MASDERDARVRAMDPVVDAVGEAVVSGYRALELVVEGLAESLRRRPGRSGGGAGGGRARTTRGDTAPATVVVELTELAADMLGRIGEAGLDIAGQLSQRQGRREQTWSPTLALSGAAGKKATVSYDLHNRADKAMSNVGFTVTDLNGPDSPIPAAKVTFAHGKSARVKRVPPHRSVRVKVTVDIPASAPPGTYRGVVTAHIPPPAGRGTEAHAGDAPWALLELEVEQARS